MTDKPKDYSGTLLRMAGNIAAGLVGNDAYMSAVASTWSAAPERVAADAYKIALEILAIHQLGRSEGNEP